MEDCIFCKIVKHEIPSDINLKNISSELRTLPKPTGSYQVGLKTIDLIDESRENRLVPIWIYFPMKKEAHVTFPKVIEKRALDLF